MDKYHRLKGQKLAALFLVGCLLFTYPVLHAFNRTGFLLGIPILYIYIFTSWAALIGLTLIIIEARS